MKIKPDIVIQPLKEREMLLWASAGVPSFFFSSRELQHHTKKKKDLAAPNGHDNPASSSEKPSIALYRLPTSLHPSLYASLPPSSPSLPSSPSVPSSLHPCHPPSLPSLSFHPSLRLSIPHSLLFYFLPSLPFFILFSLPPNL